MAMLDLYCERLGAGLAVLALLAWHQRRSQGSWLLVVTTGLFSICCYCAACRCRLRLEPSTASPHPLATDPEADHRETGRRI